MLRVGLGDHLAGGTAVRFGGRLTVVAARQDAVIANLIFVYICASIIEKHVAR
jgi:hypothetical protein